MAYVPIDDNRKFTELYTVQRLKSSFVDKGADVCISTIQRLYSLLQDKELDEAQGPGFGRLQRQNPARILRLHLHRRMPPQHLQPLVAGA
mgnify:FL=1